MRVFQNGRRIAQRTCLALALAVVCVAASGAPSPSLLNRKAPAVALRDLNGKPLDLAQLRGKVVLLNFWATWCAPCQLEMPAFDRWQQQYAARGLVVAGISMDDDQPPVRALIAKLRITYPIAMGTAALGRSYGGVLGLPETFLIDRDGIVRAQFQGEADLNKIEAALKELLDKR